MVDAATGRHPPYSVAHVVSHEQGAMRVYCDAYRATHGMAVGRQKGELRPLVTTGARDWLRAATFGRMQS